MRFARSALGLALSLITAGALAAQPSTPDADELRSMAARFAPVDIRVDTTVLPDAERRALARLIEASRYIDAVVHAPAFGRATTHGSSRC